jgi:formylglycine-generating enzyme required for sulfatase activity
MIEGLFAGDYLLTWMDMPAYVTPDPTSITLVVGATETATAVYTTKPGTIRIVATPIDLNPSWDLDGPAGSTSGNGSATLSDMEPGEYTITWSAAAGRVTPAVTVGMLEAAGTLGFTGNYVEADSFDDLILISAGSFDMGSSSDSAERDADETQHPVTLTGDFYMKSTEVTNQEFMVMLQWAYDQGLVYADQYTVTDDFSGTALELLDLSSFQSDINYAYGEFRCENPTSPAIEVTWYGAASYCNWLNLKAGLDPVYDRTDWSIASGTTYTVEGYRLPTEAEWEYACRAGTQTRFNTGDCLVSGAEANFDGMSPLEGCLAGSSLGASTAVGSFPANVWGLHDMHGNAFEWCYDGDEDYPATAVTDPVGDGENRIVRGGSWGSTAKGCRSANRYYYSPEFSNPYIGFRVVRNAD